MVAIRSIAAAWLLVAVPTDMLGSAACAQPASLPSQVNPDSINESLRREQRRREQLRVDPAAPPPLGDVAPAASDDSAIVTLREIIVDPSAYFRPEELRALVKPFTNRPVRFSELRAMVTAINARYAAIGVVTARAVLPPQRIEDGVLRVRLVEGRVGAVRIEGGSAAAAARARDLVAPKAGTLADARDLEARILRYNRTRDGQLTATLAAGADAGETDINLQLTEPRRVAIESFIDNGGFTSTGELQGGLTLRLTRLFGTNDRATGSFVWSDGTRSLSATYGVTLGDRLRLAAGLQHGLTNVTDGELAAAGVHGVSDTLSGDVAVLVASTPRVSLVASIAGRITDSRVDVAAVRASASRTITAEPRLTLAWSAPNVSIQVSQGVQFATTDERTTSLVRHATLFRGSASLALRPFGTSFVRLRGEWQASAASELNGVLQLLVGGAGSVRGFAPGTLGGDRGGYGALEAGADVRIVGVSMAPFAFIDGASVSTSQVTAAIASAGAGLAIDTGQRFSIQSYVAVPIHDDDGVNRGWRGFIAFSARF